MTHEDVWEEDRWNPEGNEWDDAADPVGTFGVAQPSHQDNPQAEPMSEQYGHPGSGSVPDARMNLIDSVRHGAQQTLPVQEVHHVLENVERGSEALRFHQETILGLASIPILQPNSNRKRALVKNLAASTTSFNVAQTSQSNSQVTYTVPAGQTWSNIVNLVQVFVTSAVAGNRVVAVIVRGPAANVIAEYIMSVAQPASTTALFQSLNGATTDAANGPAGATVHTFPNVLQGVTLVAGSTIQFQTIAAADAGDTYGGTMTVTATVATGTVVLMPLRDGGNAAAPNVGWKLQGGDAIEIKTQGGIEAVGASATDGGTLMVYEELVGARADSPSLAS